mmetsp:Transcript_30080/g.48984  ORF Transcript_30080/g.48984 Transcript_30080/m.48984 type:complete len:729 (-) Transcript_30080:348-2534(-)
MWRKWFVVALVYLGCECGGQLSEAATVLSRRVVREVHTGGRSDISSVPASRKSFAETHMCQRFTRCKSSRMMFRDQGERWQSRDIPLKQDNDDSRKNNFRKHGSRSNVLHPDQDSHAVPLGGAFNTDLGIAMLARLNHVASMLASATRNVQTQRTTLAPPAAVISVVEPPTEDLLRKQQDSINSRNYDYYDHRDHGESKITIIPFSSNDDIGDSKIDRRSEIYHTEVPKATKENRHIYYSSKIPKALQHLAFPVLVAAIIHKHATSPAADYIDDNVNTNIALVDDNAPPDIDAAVMKFTTDSTRSIDSRPAAKTPTNLINTINGSNSRDSNSKSTTTTTTATTTGTTTSTDITGTVLSTTTTTTTTTDSTISKKDNHPSDLQLLQFKAAPVLVSIYRLGMGDVHSHHPSLPSPLAISLAIAAIKLPPGKKKGRGRPKKPTSQIVSLLIDDSQTSLTTNMDQQPNRKRGRPKKSTTIKATTTLPLSFKATDAEVVPIVDDTAPKRKRGRPTKSSTTSTENTTTETAASSSTHASEEEDGGVTTDTPLLPKRKRGRPRKIPSTVKVKVTSSSPLESLTYGELREELTSRGLKRYGLKAELVDRLKEALLEEEEGKPEREDEINLVSTSSLSSSMSTTLDGVHQNQEADSSPQLPPPSSPSSTTSSSSTSSLSSSLSSSSENNKSAAHRSRDSDKESKGKKNKRAYILPATLLMLKHRLPFGKTKEEDRGR